MPSPESPANRIVTRSSSWTGRSGSIVVVIRLRAASSSDAVAAEG
jgi:hypothetical protein